MPCPDSVTMVDSEPALPVSLPLTDLDTALGKAMAMHRSFTLLLLA